MIRSDLALIVCLVLTGEVALINSESCEPPRAPKNGFWKLHDGNSDLLILEDGLPEGTTVQIFCSGNHFLKGEETLLCRNGEWSSEVGLCLAKCPSIHSTPKIVAKCSLEGRQLDNCVNPPISTVVTFSCRGYNYGSPGIATSKCLAGVWVDFKPLDCQPVCGNKEMDVRPLILGGIDAKSVPWQVAVFHKEKALICSGTLITPSLILTAAQCVSPFSRQGKPKEEYTVAVGKYDIEFNSTSDAAVQYSSLKRILSHERYRGNVKNKISDIAILVTKNPFRISHLVQPACLSFEEGDFSEGWVAGWGYFDRSYKLPKTLQEAKMRIVNRTFCQKVESEKFSENFDYDKFCAGDVEDGKDACAGDEGGGLVVRNQTDGKFYLRGIISAGVSGCTSGHYAFYTDVSIYSEFINNARNDIENEGSEDRRSETPPKPCALPSYPRNGVWNVLSKETFFPKNDVSSGTILNIFCHREYLLEGKDYLVCENGKWNSKIGECLAKCSPIYSTPKTEVKCKFNNIEIENCTNVPSSTVATFRCKEYYQDFNLFKTGSRICRDGVWLQDLPDCKLVCGNRNGTTDAKLLVYGGDDTNIENFPWQVAIYNKKKILSCGGSLISQNMILTAAHCVTALFDGALLPKENYEVAVGKYYTEYRSSKEGSEVQYSNITKIVIHDSYRGFLQHYVADIAVLFTEITFQLSLRVQPVCVSPSPDIDQNLAAEGWVPGWGITEDGRQTDTLKVLKVPVLEKKYCESSPFTINYLTHDKMCVGYFNQSKSVCKGDSGGGLVFRNSNNGRYYLKGMVSLSPPSESGCSSENFGLFTNVSVYIQFIDEARNKI